MKDYSIPTEEQLARQAHDLILADLRVYDTVAQLAAKTGTNSFTLKAAFKKYYHCSVFSFSRAVRMEKAKALLLETNYTLQTIADLVGYTEGNNFQASFKKVVGCTPGDWRKKGIAARDDR